jgi:pyruvate/2-oxoacid:ferredoxin oxidoreductase alpha subunit
MRDLLTGNYAIAEAVRLARVELVAAYPITPQTPIYEKLSEMDAQGKLAGMMVRMESEHSAMASLIAASLAGARTFTATASQGLVLMHEMLHMASGARVPVVMACVNRVLGVPWAFGSDQTDTLAQRDTGWIQFYCENGQEALDTVIQAYKIAEQVLFPVMVVIDGFFTSHFMEPVDIPDQDLIDAYLPQGRVPNRFDTEDPAYVISVVNPPEYFRLRQNSFIDMELSRPVIAAADREYMELTGRGYGVIETTNTADAEVVLVTSGAMTSTARVAIESLRQKGCKAGLLKIKGFRPFPTSEIRQALAGVPKVAVIDRNISMGKEGIFCQEIRSALCALEKRSMVQGYIAGICGTNISPETLEEIAIGTLEKDKAEDLPLWVQEE